MAHDAMAREFGPIEAVPPPPPQSFSRYRSLRGKSVSSPRDFDIYREQRHGDNEPSPDDPGQSSSGSPRSRSRSVNSFHRSMRHEAATVPLVPAVPAVPAMPAVPAVPLMPLPLKVLSPKPINVAAQSSLRILENLKSPMLSHLNPPWRSLGSVSRPANQVEDSHCGVPGPHTRPFNGDGDGDEQQTTDTATSTSSTTTATSTFDASSSDAGGSAEAYEHLDAAGQADVVDGEHKQLPPLPPLPQPHQEPEPEQREAQRRETSNDGHGGQLAHEIARLEAETDRILAEQKKLDLARLQAQLVTPPPKPKRQILEKLSIFSRSKRTTASSSQPSTPSTTVSSIFSPTLSHYSRGSSLEEPPTPPPAATTKMSFIEAGGKGIVPQADAPLSAINGGERRVIVRCFTSTINLPVTADTSPIEILTAAAGMTRHHLTPATSVIIECYFVLGLERRLRRYERIRDVMNSWDRDQQNSLLIMSGDSSDCHQDLELCSVPRTEEPPSGFSVQMFHSAKPGKWNKRWITLLENGQIYAAKSANAQPSDKESSVLCHLTDFDIYTPKESEMRRNLKPPKRFCYAIKSQQKTVVFPNGENFVHFFSTEDAQQATCFYEQVHGWRSWYLANRLVDLERKSKPPRLVLDTKPVAPRPKNGLQSAKASESSSASTAPEEASEPLMNVDEFRVSKIVLEDAKLKKSSSIRSTTSSHEADPGRRQGASGIDIPQTVKEGDAEFSAGGLLGDAYEKRKQAESSPITSNIQNKDGPFTGGPSLLNGGISKSSSDSSDLAKDAEQGDKTAEPRSWFPSAAEHSARIRSQSVHAQQRRPMTADASSSAGAARRERHRAPLLSFSKDFPEPPRFQNGPNPGVRQAPGQPLINFATGGASRDAARDGAVRRNASRRAAPAFSGGSPTGTGGSPAFPPPPPPPPGTQRGRSKSSASQRRFNPMDVQHHPVPPLPNMRRPQQGELPLRQLQRGPQEPLVNRAR